MDEEKIDKLFQEVAEKNRNPPKNVKLDTNQQLKFYGLYKAATVGKMTEENKPKPGFFDFKTKYKTEAWKKCSIYSQLEAKIEYIKFYSQVYGVKVDLPEESKNMKSLGHKFVDFDFPEDLGGTNNLYKAIEKAHQKEMDEFYKTASEQEKFFQQLKDDIYAGEVFTDEMLSNLESKNKVNCKKNLLIYSLKPKRWSGTVTSSCCC